MSLPLDNKKSFHLCSTSQRGASSSSRGQCEESSRVWAAGLARAAVCSTCSLPGPCDLLCTPAKSWISGYSSTTGWEVTQVKDSNFSAKTSYLFYSIYSAPIFSACILYTVLFLYHLSPRCSVPFSSQMKHPSFFHWVPFVGSLHIAHNFSPSPPPLIPTSWAGVIEGMESERANQSLERETLQIIIFLTLLMEKQKIGEVSW